MVFIVAGGACKQQILCPDNDRAREIQASERQEQRLHNLKTKTACTYDYRSKKIGLRNISGPLADSIKKQQCTSYAFCLLSQINVVATGTHDSMETCTSV
jgi:hypothetical protein